MPNVQRCIEMLGTSTGEFIGIRRSLLSELMKMFDKIVLPEAQLSFDTAVAASTIASIGPSEEAIHSNLPYYVAFLKYVIKKLGLNMDDPELSEEDREERRRLWWISYALDRHSALSANLRPQFTDQECQDLPFPCPESVWETQDPLPSACTVPTSQSLRVLGYTTPSLDVLGVLVSLSRILGEVLEYHFLQQQATFNSPEGLSRIRENIQGNLDSWLESFRAHLPPAFCDSITKPGSAYSWSVAIPCMSYYGLYLYHCLHILLYGKMDLVCMYEDVEWQVSPDFLKAGEHAMACANITRSIMVVDPHFHFLYRLFGTYLVQSSFIFLILARKFGSMSDQLILDNCAINLQVLDIFVQNSNMTYQRDFAKILRNTLSRGVADRSLDSGQHVHSAETAKELLDPELLRYRWIAGYSGLWASSNELASR